MASRESWTSVKPGAGPVESPNAISGNSAPVLKSEVNDRGSNALAIVALIAACLALGAVGMYVTLASQLIDAKIAAGSADAKAIAGLARTQALVNEDKLKDLRDQLNARGLKIEELNGHH